MDANVLKKISMWNNANLEASLRNELNNLSEEELEDAFYVDLAFGTNLSVSGPGTSARIRCIEFFSSNDTITITNTRTPIPPIQ